jgi:hypothetical protein
MDRTEREAYIDWRISGLRRRGPRVIGLEHGGSQPTPVSVGTDTMHMYIDLGSANSPLDVARGLDAALTQSPVPLDSMSLLYGDYFDVTAPLAEVTTVYQGPDWPNAAAPSRRPASAWALGQAEWRDDQIARGEWSSFPPAQESKPDGPFRRGKIDIIVCGTRCRVPVVSYRHYQALSFSDGTTPVTVVSRHPLPDLPQFNWVTDLEPYFAGYRRRTHETAERAGLVS